MDINCDILLVNLRVPLNTSGVCLISTFDKIFIFPSLIFHITGLKPLRLCCCHLGDVPKPQKSLVRGGEGRKKQTEEDKINTVLFVFSRFPFKGNLHVYWVGINSFLEIVNRRYVYSTPQFIVFLLVTETRTTNRPEEPHVP